MALRMYWTDEEWKRLEEAVVHRTTLTERLNAAGQGSIATDHVPENAVGLIVYLENGEEIWRGRVVALHGKEVEDEVKVRLIDLKGMLGGYLAWPEPGGNFGSQEFDSFTGPASSACIHYVDANVGPSAPDWRRMGITIGHDPGAGETVQVNARFDNLLSLLKDIASLGGIRFRFDGTTFYAESGRKVNDIVFGKRAGTVHSLTWSYTAPKTNAVIAAGSGSGTARLLISTYNMVDVIKWGVQEGFWDVRGVDDAATLADLGRKYLEAQRSGYAAVIKPSIAPRGDIYPGDEIRVQIGNREISMRVLSITWTMSEWTIRAAEGYEIPMPDGMDMGLQETRKKVERLSTG